MAKQVRKFVDPAGAYTGGYTSNIVLGNAHDNSDAVRGIIQVQHTAGNVSLQFRLTEDADWLTVRTYTANSMEECALAPQMRIIVDDAAEVWLAELT